MKKGPRPQRIPSAMRRNPSASHVQFLQSRREQLKKPRARLPVVRGSPLTFERYKALLADYQARAERDLAPKERHAERQQGTILSLLFTETRPEILKQLLEGLQRIKPLTTTTVSEPEQGFMIAKEIISDFKHTKGLRVFGLGVGYGQLLFFLKNFMGAKVQGVELGNFSEDLTKKKKLGVIHNVDWNAPQIRKLGKFDVTYSVNVFDPFAINTESARSMLDIASHLTRVGGKSYHVVNLGPSWPATESDILQRGFRIDSVQETHRGIALIKLTKIRD